MVEPIRPQDIAAHKAKNIPDYVIEAFNNEIAKKYNHNSKTSIVRQDDVVNAAIKLRISTSTTDIPNYDEHVYRQEIYENHFLDIEQIYEANGWNVSYEKPGYCESGYACFTFKQKGCTV